MWPFETPVSDPRQIDMFPQEKPLASVVLPVEDITKPTRAEREQTASITRAVQNNLGVNRMASRQESAENHRADADYWRNTARTEENDAPIDNQESRIISSMPRFVSVLHGQSSEDYGDTKLSLGKSDKGYHFQLESGQGISSTSRWSRAYPTESVATRLGYQAQKSYHDTGLVITRARHVGLLEDAAALRVSGRIDEAMATVYEAQRVRESRVTKAAFDMPTAVDQHRAERPRLRQGM